MGRIERFTLIIVLILIFIPLLMASRGEEEKIEGVKEETEVKPEERMLPIKPPEMEVKEPLQGIIKGRVLDESNNPVGGVEVTCFNAEGNLVARTITDKDGNYEFKGLEKGEYSISASYTGFARTEIKFDEKRRKPPIPTGLKVSEISQDVLNGSFIRAQWDKMPDVESYRCELYVKGERSPKITYPDIKQNYCEFGDLEEDTDYQVRIYSKNILGYSTSYALGIIRTMNKTPTQPFGLGVVYAKNNRVDLVWNGVDTKDLQGYVLQLKVENGPFLFYSKKGLVSEKGEATVIKGIDKGLVTYSISDWLEDNTPLIENVTPYSFRVFSIDKGGMLSKPSSPIEGVILEDTVPPLPPTNIKYEFINENRLRISWEFGDRDIDRYRLYYGFGIDRWEGVITTRETAYELIVNKAQMRDKELFVTVISIDRAGNESGYKPIVKKTLIPDKEKVTEDIVLSLDSVYRDYSPWVQQPPKEEKKVPVRKKVEKKPVVIKEYEFPHLKEKGFIVKNGETATLRGKITVPEKVTIVVEAGGTLIIDGAEIAPSGGIWGGVQYQGGAGGYLRNSVISNASVGITILNHEKLFQMSNVEIRDCEASGVNIRDSKAELSLITVKNNKIGIFIENSAVSIINSLIEDNEKGILAYNYGTNIEDSRFKNNKVYGLRLYGGGIVKGSVFIKNLVAVVLEEGRGSVLLTSSKIENNLMDGIVVNTSSAEIKNNLIANNGRHGIYVKGIGNPDIIRNDIINNREYAVIGGGKINGSYIAYNNESTYVDDTSEKGRPDNVMSSSSSGLMKQILNVDFITGPSLSPLL